MASEDEGRGKVQSVEETLDDRDLLVGRPERAERKSMVAPAKTAPTPPPATCAQPAEHDDAIQEILATVRATAARIDALQDRTTPTNGTAEELARETAALNQAVVDARGALARAAELAAGRDGTGRRRLRAPWPGPPPR